ncbi:MAG: RNA-binding protein [Pseudomonadota bacterium]|nr:RNA-binding protein [Gammaproteobacteria bacterium]MBU1559066.1 RNA-binding protein [Gammaproteobacteria bacterium]MBU1926581.1 RNA-binding protein [Gammaproteobacteria bacterium]MBU2546087.1 RNA-binding protein [Gammaproteobacteria bacterium]
MNPKKIYVGNLSYSTTGEDLNEFFSQYGTISEVKLISDFEGRSKGFGFITFETEEGAQSSLQANDVDLQGRKLKVNIARDKPASDGASRGGRGGRGGSSSGGGRFGGFHGGNR